MSARTTKREAALASGLGTFSVIDAHLVAGGMPGNAGEGRAVSWPNLSELGVTVLFSLVDQEIDGLPGWLLQERHPIIDSSEDGKSGASIAYLKRVVERLGHLRSAKRVVYLHCQAGVSRTGLVLCAWRMKSAGESKRAALDWVRTRRACIQPNPSFLALLDEWEDLVGRVNTAP